MAKQKLETIEWEKPTGNKITTNALPATVEYAESLNWKRVKKPEGKK